MICSKLNELGGESICIVNFFREGGDDLSSILFNELIRQEEQTTVQSLLMFSLYIL